MTVSIPRDEKGNLESGTLRIYLSVLAMHLIVSLALIANHYYSTVIRASKHSINIFVVLYYAIVFIFIGVYWVFPNEFDPDSE